MSAATKAIFAIDSIAELNEVQSALNVRFRELQHRAAISFRVGDKVKFQSRTGNTISGTVTKVNQKTVSVVATTGHNWKVSGSLLQRA